MLPVAPPTSTIVSSRDGWGLLAMETDHHLAEQRRFLGMLCEVLEDGYALRFLKAGFAGLNGVAQIIPATLSRRAA
jgi:hypothetical protein